MGRSVVALNQREGERIPSKMPDLQSCREGALPLDTKIQVIARDSRQG